MNRLRVRLLALFTALLSLAAVGVPARAQHFCRMMERVVDSCCCESSAIESGGAELKAPDCCVRLTRGALPAAEVRREVFPLPSSPAVVPVGPLLLVAAAEVELPNVGRLAQRVLPTRGPPLFLRDCALLI